MARQSRILIFIVGFLCAWILFSSSRNVLSQSSLPSDVTFSGESNVIYFMDRGEARLYRYNVQGRLTKVYILDELGKDLKLER